MSAGFGPLQRNKVCARVAGCNRRAASRLTRVHARDWKAPNPCLGEGMLKVSRLTIAESSPVKRKCAD